MKKVFKYAIMAFAGCISLCLASCSNDDEPDSDDDELWKGEATTPKYASDAAIYTVNPGVQCPFESIELTESGDYIVTPSVADYNSPAQRSESSTNRGMFKRSKTSNTRAGLSTYDYTYGTFTKNSDGSYNLEGLGTMSYSDGTLNLKLTDGTDYNVAATEKKPDLDANKLNMRLCRTWKVTGAVEEVYNKSGKKLDSYTYSGTELQDEFVEYVLISRNGSYVSIDWDNTIEEKGTWMWADTSKQIFSYSEPDDRGTMQVFFNGDKAKFKQSWTGYDEDYEQEITYNIIISCTSK